MMVSVNTNQLITWWETSQNTLHIFLDVMKGGNEIPDKQVNSALQYFNARIPEFEQLPYPADAHNIREQLLEAMGNVQQSLRYRKEQNDYQARLRLEMAQGNIDAMRLYLIQYNILL